MSICSDCKACLDKKKLSGKALANGFYSGRHIAANLPTLPHLELKIIRRVRFGHHIIKLRRNEHLHQSKLPLQRGFKGHVMVYPQNLNPLLSLIMPNPSPDLANDMNIIFVSTKEEADLLELEIFTELFKVRRCVIRKWFCFLKEHHPSYKDVVLLMML